MVLDFVYFVFAGRENVLELLNTLLEFALLLAGDFVLVILRKVAERARFLNLDDDFFSALVLFVVEFVLELLQLSRSDLYSHFYLPAL